MHLTILFGAQSYEHEISIVSAIALKKVLPSTTVDYIFVDRFREFYKIDAKKITSKLFSSGDYADMPKLTLKQGGFFQKSLLGEKHVPVGTVLNLVHGGDGEDGKIAGMLEFFGVPYIGPRMEACVLSFSKKLTKYLAAAQEIPALSFQIVTQETRKHFAPEYPVIIKPLRLGSSIGVTVVKSEAELDYALDVAFEFDREVLAEPFIDGVKEYNLAGCRAGNDWLFSIVEEPGKEEFLDFDKKYLDFTRTQRVAKADITPETEEALRDAFMKIYEGLFEGSLIRCDFFFIDGRVYLNEINPIPGSMANYLFDDFEGILHTLAEHLPVYKNVPVEYRYLHEIQAAKGK